MIEPRELRLGNLVQSKSFITGTLHIWEVFIDDLVEIYNQPDRYLPVPISQISAVTHGSIGIAFMPVGIYLLVGSEEVKLPNIKWVHQLQNLVFDLTGQELDVSGYLK